MSSGSCRARAADGVAWMDGQFMPLAEAKIGVTDWGLVRSDATYDVVSVWDGAFFRLEDHLDRFLASMGKLRMTIPQNRDDIRNILVECVRRSGLRRSYVAFVCTRGAPVYPSRMPGACRNVFFAYARPWVWVFPEEVMKRGAALIIPGQVRIPAESVDPRVKNYHWGDMTYGLLEAERAGADSALLADADGMICEGPGFNIFAVKDGRLLTPNRGVLEGISRRTALEIGEELGMSAEVRPLPIAEFMEADEVFATTSAGGVCPVRKVDERVFSNNAPGPATLSILDKYWEVRRRPEHRKDVDYEDRGDARRRE